MTAETFTVVIVGAGPTGVTVATLLGQYGIDCLILDRFSDVYPQPRAVHLDDEICRIIARLGVYEDFAAISRPSRGLRLLDSHMGVLAEFNRETTRSVHGYAKANMFDQPDLEVVLRANLRHQPTVQLRCNAEVIAIEQSGNSVLVGFTDRGSGTRHSVRARYVLGCDGANSVVRAAIGAGMQDLEFEQRWLVVDVATDANLDQWDGVHQVCDPSRAATYMRIGPTRYRWEFQLLPTESAAEYADIATLEPLIRPWTGAVPADRLNVVRAAEYTFRAQIADRWRRGNVFLLGDAAHLTPPFIGQGMGAGLRDAMNLAWKLAGVLDGSLPKPMLDTYQQERKPHARTMILLALAMGKAMTARGRFADVLRRAIAPRLHYVPGLRAKVLDSATPTLSRTALVRKRLLPFQAAGTLCPNPKIMGQRFDDRVGGRFAVVTAKAPTIAQLRDIEQRGAVLVLAPPGTDLYAWLRSRRATAAVVRPDRTVMFAAHDVADVCSRLPAFEVARRTHHVPNPPSLQRRTDR